MRRFRARQWCGLFLECPVNAIAFQTYEQEATLFAQIVGTSDPAARIAIPDAAWNLTGAAFGLVGNWAARNWVAAAEDPASYQHVNLTGIFILSASMGLFGGTLALACFQRRFSRGRIG